MMDGVNILKENNDRLVEFFKENHIQYRKYSQQKCYVLKMNQKNSLSQEWMRYFRGLVYNYEKQMLLVCPPPKSEEVDFTVFQSMVNENKIQFTELYDGTMINLFYNNDRWNLSSRSTIGCNNRWLQDMTYKELFDETCTIDYDSLNKEHSYTFVLRNKKNRNISPLLQDEIRLVQIFDTKNCVFIDLYDLGFTIPQQYTCTDSLESLTIYTKGYTFLFENKRYKWLTPQFKRMKEIKLNVNDKSILYLELRKNGNVKEYLSYFPEDNDIFSKTRETFHDIKNELYNSYLSIYVKKETLFKDANYEYKPLIKDIHNIYRSTGYRIRGKQVEDYLHNLPSKKVKFVMNFR